MKHSLDKLTPATGQRNGLNGWLDELRSAVTTLETDGRIERLVWGLSEAAERMAAEHTGMAEELLCVYEQLGVVFEVTRRLPTVHSESEVIKLFLGSLHRSFDRRLVFATRPRTGGGWSVMSGDIEVSDWMEALIIQARDQGKVVVEAPPPGAMSRSIAQVMVGPVSAGDGFVCAIVLTRSPSVAEFRASDMLLLESLTIFCGDLIRNHRLLRELRGMSLTMVRSLVNAVDQKDEYTSGHSLRVGYFAMLLAEKLQLGGTELRMLRWSALLHDVGKIGIRDSVLKKAGKLTSEEFGHIKEHPIRSHKVVQEVPQLAGALAGVLYHHEKCDGTGYPAGLKGRDIPLQARIIQIADVFDALTSDRAYRPAYDWRKALAIMEEEAGKTVDPLLQSVFSRMMLEMLDDDPQAWEMMLRRANRFTETTEDDLCEDEGE